MSLKLSVATVVVAVVPLLLAGAAKPDPTYVPWVSLLPTIAEPVDPTSTNPCRNGSLEWVERTIREMSAMYADTAATCDRNAVFPFAYLLVTQGYGRTVDATPTFFADTRFVNNEDAVFAGYYFRAYNDWYGGHPEAVPLAWQIAFSAGDERRVSGSGDLLLGINAHVNRDLPFVLDALGLFDSDGSSRKPDHDKVNVILNRVMNAILAGAAQRFDPTIVDPSSDPTGVTSTGLFQTLEAWREEAWRNAERLAAASSAAEWDQVAASIEDAAAANAKAIALAYAYDPPLTTTVARDSYCSAHDGDRTP